MAIFRGSRGSTVASGEIVATTTEIVEALNAAIAAKDDAEVARIAAELAQSNAETAESGAEDAKDQAEAIVNQFVETVAITDETINRDDGGIQVLDLSSNVSVTIDMDEGQSLTLHVKNLDTFTVNWPSAAIFIGGLPATFNPNLDVFEFWVVENELYGAWVGGA